MYFSIRIRTVFAVAGSLAILHDAFGHPLKAAKLHAMEVQTTGNRQLGGVTGYTSEPRGSLLMATICQKDGSRTLTSVEVEEAKDKEIHHSLHINATGLPTNCVGCTIAIALIKTDSCSKTDAYDSALTFSLQDALTYVTNEDGSTNGWKTTTFRELIDSNNNNNSTLPLSLVDALNPATSTDSKVAVYLYDMEENPIACATFEQASEEEAAMYKKLLYDESESGEEQDDGPDAAAVNPLEDDTSSASGGLELVSAFVTGVSLFASGAILVFV